MGEGRVVTLRSDSTSPVVGSSRGRHGGNGGLLTYRQLWLRNVWGFALSWVPIDASGRRDATQDQS